jgi:hypothetical protein
MDKAARFQLLPEFVRNFGLQRVPVLTDLTIAAGAMSSATATSGAAEN